MNAARARLHAREMHEKLPPFCRKEAQYANMQHNTPKLRMQLNAVGTVHIVLGFAGCWPKQRPEVFNEPAIDELGHALVLGSISVTK